MLQSTQAELTSIDEKLDQLKPLQKKQIELRAVIAALSKLKESQTDTATTEAFVRPRMLEERRVLMLEYLMESKRSQRFREILKGLRALHGPGVSKNHLTAALKDPRFEKIAVEGRHPRWRVKFSHPHPPT